MDILTKARTLFASDRYATSLSGIEIAAVGDHQAECIMLLSADHCNARGVAMGGAIYTLADFCAAVAANSEYIESGDLHWVSLDATVHYLAPAPVEATLKATCVAIKTGRTTALMHTTIESPDNGKLVAIVETTMIMC